MVIVLKIKLLFTESKLTLYISLIISIKIKKNKLIYIIFKKKKYIIIKNIKKIKKL